MAGAHVLPRRADDARRGLSRMRAFRLCTWGAFNGRSTEGSTRGDLGHMHMHLHLGPARLVS